MEDACQGSRLGLAAATSTCLDTLLPFDRIDEGTHASIAKSGLLGQIATSILGLFIHTSNNHHCMKRAGLSNWASINLSQKLARCC